MTSTKISDPLPPVTVTNQLILFLSSAFWAPLPPPTADVIYGSPLTLYLLAGWVLDELVLASPRGTTSSRIQA